MRAVDPGVTVIEAAKKMGLSPNSLRAYIQRGTREGWLRFDDSIDRIRHEIVPKVLDNISGFLDAKDKTVTIETAKGTIFRTYQAAEGALDGQQTVLGLKIEMIGGPLDQQPVLMGQVIGKPKELKQ
jgi:hypothetical protein